MKVKKSWRILFICFLVCMVLPFAIAIKFGFAYVALYAVTLIYFAYIVDKFMGDN
jgi:hypothetical protein